VDCREEHCPLERDRNGSRFAVGLALLVLCAASSPQAKAVDVAVGSYGLYDPLQKGGILSAAARTGRDSLLNFEARAGYGLPGGVNRASDTVKTLVGIADQGSGDVRFQQEVHFDRFLAEALVDLSPRRELGRTQVVPHVRLGTGLLFRQTVYAVYSEDNEEHIEFRNPEGNVTIPFIGEFTFELWSLHNFGIRFCAGFVANMQKEYQWDPDTPAEGNVLNMRPRVGLDILYTVGGR